VRLVKTWNDGERRYIARRHRNRWQLLLLLELRRLRGRERGSTYLLKFLGQVLITKII
jgi:hypothetical protein